MPVLYIRFVYKSQIILINTNYTRKKTQHMVLFSIVKKGANVLQTREQQAESMQLFLSCKQESNTEAESMWFSLRVGHAHMNMTLGNGELRYIDYLHDYVQRKWTSGAHSLRKQKRTPCASKSGQKHTLSTFGLFAKHWKENEKKKKHSFRHSQQSLFNISCEVLWTLRVLIMPAVELHSKYSYLVQSCASRQVCVYAQSYTILTPVPSTSVHPQVAQ